MVNESGWRPRPAFEPGNRVAQRHGAWSPRTWRPLADAIAAEVVDVAPWAARPVYASAVAAWARVEAQLQLVLAWLDERGPLDDDGVPRPATGLLARLEAQAAGLRAELGLTPAALARLLSAFREARHDDEGLAALIAEGRRLRLEHGGDR